MVRWMVQGPAEGVVLALDEPLSFWGGFDAETGLIIDERHPQLGSNVAGRILVMAAGRGSSSASSVLAEAIRRGTAPAAVLLGSSDEIIVLGAVVADELYGHLMPVGVTTPEFYHRVRVASAVQIHADGSIDVR